MKIGVVRSNGIYPKNSLQANNGFKNRISFGSNADIFERQDRAKIYENLKSLFDSHDVVYEKLKQRAISFRDDHTDMFEKAAEVQNLKKVSDDDKSELAKFLKSMNKDKMKPVNEAYDIMEEAISGRLKYGVEDFIKNKSAGSCVLFKSSDKQLAKDLASLYPFYGLLRRDKKDTCSGTFELLDLYGNKNFLFETEILEPAKDSQNPKEMFDGYFKQLLQKMNDHKPSKRAGFYIVDDLEGLLDEKQNSKENMEAMQKILSSFDEYKGIFIAGSQEFSNLPAESILCEIDLDSLGVTKEHIEAMKFAREKIGEPVKELADIFGKMPEEDLKRLEEIKGIINNDMAPVNKKIEEFIYTKKRDVLCIGIMDDESIDLAHFKPIETYTKTKRSVIDKLLEEKIDLKGKEEIVEPIITVIEEEPVSQTAKKTFKEQLLSIKQKIKNMPPDKLFKYGAIALGIITLVAYIAKRIKVSKQSK